MDGCREAKSHFELPDGHLSSFHDLRRNCAIKSGQVAAYCHSSNASGSRRLGTSQAQPHIIVFNVRRPPFHASRALRQILETRTQIEGRTRKSLLCASCLPVLCSGGLVFGTTVCKANKRGSSGSGTARIVSCLNHLPISLPLFSGYLPPNIPVTFHACPS